MIQSVCQAEECQHQVCRVPLLLPGSPAITSISTFITHQSPPTTNIQSLPAVTSISTFISYQSPPTITIQSPPAITIKSTFIKLSITTYHHYSINHHLPSPAYQPSSVTTYYHYSISTCHHQHIHLHQPSSITIYHHYLIHHHLPSLFNH